ncbi:MAG: ExeM/NucH family extracellular endonuclease [Anaerolineaceae bacterium]|nr:ExeM/NucH family extracellular endonuclease [Anaerolineaceae bacterium]
MKSIPKPLYILMVLAMLAGMIGMQPVKPVQAISPDLRISQVYGGGGNSDATYTHDFIEIFNSGSNAVSLSGMSVQYASGIGTGNFGSNSTQITELPDITLDSGHYYLIQEASSGSIGAPLPVTADFTDTTPINMSGSGGKVALVNSQTSLGCNGSSTVCSPAQLALIVDLVGYGGANFYEGTAAAPVLGNSTSAQRKGGGCIDTDDNGADFEELTPAPRNSASPTHSCGATVYPERFIISEYIEGSSNTKAIELYNGTGADINLQNFKLVLYTNGSTAPGNTLTWAEETILANGDTYVIANAGAIAGILALADITHNVTYYNGDDPLILYKITASGDVVQDSFGRLGEDPGTGWGSGDTFTAEHTLVRKANICSGDLIPDDVFEPANEWNGFPQNTYADLGSHTMTCGPAVDVPPTVSATVPANNATNVAPTSDIVITFSETVTVAESWYSISCATSGAHTAMVADDNPIFTLDPDSDFAASEVCTVSVVAAKVSDQDGTADAMEANYSFSFTTAEACGVNFTPIYDIQGAGLTTPMPNATVTTEGVVVGDFQVGGKNGFYIQDAIGDANTSTSDGIFIYYTTAPDVVVGDKVRLTGKVSEYNGQTQITGSAMQICSTDHVITPTEITLPVASVDDFEKYEGMLVTFPQSLVIAEYFNYDRYGEIVLTSQRHMTPTAIVEPGAPAQAAAAAYLLDRITLDDGRTPQNLHPAIHPDGTEFTLGNLFRGGGTLTNVTGVMDYMFDLYRIQPTQGAVYTDTNPRTTAPDIVEGDLAVASFNVLNYFVTLDGSGDICGPAGNVNCRGADNPAEFVRQRAKILAALDEINADVYGLMEIENDRPGGEDPVADLVDGLNDIQGAGTYAYIDTGSIGTDAIKQAILYKPAQVTPVGAYKILDTSVDPRFIDTANRPVLAQVFEDNETGVKFVVAVNHLKSKGSACVGDPDLGDGAGNCNLTRLAAAEAMVDWLADPAIFGDVEKVLIIGDLNSYDKEDPIDAIKLGADDTADTDDDYLDMIFEKQGDEAYGYVFDGQTGYLDYALANLALAENIVDANLWHINADEPDIIDYDNSFKPVAQAALLYAPDLYRSSDHDPVIVTLSFAGDFFVTQDFGPWGPNWPGAINLGWKLNDDFDIDTIASIEVGMLDAAGELIVKYDADAEQIAYQKENSYITQGGQSSAPFYQWYNGTPIAEGRDLDWTVVFGPSFGEWTPALGFVKIVNLNGTVDYKTVPYTAAPVYEDDIFEITDFGLWGQSWPGALSLGWGYLEAFDTDTIASIEVGMVDADRDVIVRYTADAEQVAWQKANGYITATKLSSAPFYQKYNGLPIVEGSDLDWTAIFGPAFEGWDPAWAYVRVITTSGAVDYDEITYTGVLPGETPEISSTDLEGPYVIGQNQEFHVTLDNSERGYAYSNVLAMFEVENITLADIESFEYLETSVTPNVWLPLPLTQTETGVVGAFGPAAGFPITVPYNATSSFRITFITPGTYPATITLYDVAAEPDSILDIFTADVVAATEFSVTDVVLTRSVDQTTWYNVPGSFAGGFAMPLHPAEDYYYFGVSSITATHALADGSYPFYLTGNPGAEFFTYWAGRGVVDGATGWQGLMWQIINGDAPMFNLAVDEGAYSLIDGLQGAPNLLRINGDYLPGAYVFSGTITDEYGLTDELLVNMIFNDIPVVADQTVTTDEDEALDITLMVADLYPQPATLSWVINSDPANGTLSGTAPNLTYTPDANWYGTDSFTYSVHDGTLGSNVATVTINVTSVNDAPTAEDQAVTTAEDTPVDITLEAADIEGDPLTFLVVVEPLHGEVVIVGNVATYTPDPDYFGADNFTFKANDGTDDSNIATVTITVTEVKDQVQAVDDEYETNEDTTLTVAAPGVLGNDIDVDLNIMTAGLVRDVEHGQLSLMGDGSFVYTPDADFYGVDSFEYQLVTYPATMSLWTDTAIVTITVHPVLDPPTISSDDIEGPYYVGYLREFNVTLDNPTNGDPFTALRASVFVDNITLADFSVMEVKHPLTGIWVPLVPVVEGTGLKLDLGPTVTYPIAPGQSMTLTFRVNFNTTGNYPATGTLFNAAVTPEVALDTFNATLQVLDVEIFDITDFGLWGAYWPGALSLGWQYVTAFDTLDIASIEVGMLDANRDPIIIYTADDAQVAWQRANGYINSARQSSAPFYAFYDGSPIPEGRDFDWTVIYGPEFEAWDPAWGYVRVVDLNGYVEYEEIAYTGARPDITPPTVDEAVAEGVDPYDDVTAVDLTFTVAQGYTVGQIVLTMSEPVTIAEGTEVTLAGVPYGSIEVDTTGLIVTVIPHAGNEVANLIGTFTFSVPADSILDQAGHPLESIEATLIVTNVAPVAEDDTYTVAEDGVLTVLAATGVLDNDTDFDPTILTAVLEAGPVDGTLVLNADGSFTYTPDANFNGTETFTYRAYDGDDYSNIATVTITVTPVNDDPVAEDQSVTTAEDTAVDITLVASDVDGDPLTYEVVTQPAHGTVTLAGNLGTYTPALDYNGPDSFTFKANDGAADSNIATVSITITPVNDAPVAQNQSVSTPEDTQIAITLVATDVEEQPLTYTILTQPINGNVNLVGNVATYTPAPDHYGADSFTFMANDGSLNSNVATVSITVTPVNDAPVAIDDEYMVEEGGELTIVAPGILENDDDVDGDTIHAVLIDDVTNGTLTLNANGSFLYIPAPYFAGTDSFTYKASDGELESELAVVTITVTAVNEWVIANDDYYEVTADVELVKDAAEGVLANDVLLDPEEVVSIEILEGPQYGTLSMNDDGSFTYTPDAGYMGTDTFRYLVLSVNPTIQGEWSDDAYVTIVVKPFQMIYLPLVFK